MDNPDLRYSRLLARHLGERIDHHVHLQPAQVTLDDIDSVIDLAALGEDPRHVTILANYRAVHDLGMRAVLNGQGADEIMGGYVGLPAFRASILDVRHPDLSTITALPGSRQATHLSGDVLARRVEAHERVLTYHQALPGTPLERAHRLLFATQLARVVQFEDFLSMRVGVESRLPYLDHHVVQWCFALPFDMHINPRHRQGKQLLRLAARPWLPPAVHRRPKAVFPAPGPDPVAPQPQPNRLRPRRRLARRPAHRPPVHPAPDRTTRRAAAADPVAPTRPVAVASQTPAHTKPTPLKREFGQCQPMPPRHIVTSTRR